MFFILSILSMYNTRPIKIYIFYYILILDLIATSNIINYLNLIKTIEITGKRIEIIVKTIIRELLSRHFAPTT